MNIFGSMSPWSSSPFAGRARMGQVPLVLGPSSWGSQIPMVSAGAQVPPAIPDEGQEVSANGGVIRRLKGFLWFFPTESTRDAIKAATGDDPGESIEARLTYCAPTPPFAAVLGSFIDPETSFVCLIDVPAAWSEAWRHRTSE